MSEKVPPTSLAPYEDAVFNAAGAGSDPIATFLKLTSSNSPLRERTIDPDAFSDFCAAFAEGVKYVRDKFGTQPSAIVFQSESKATPYASSPLCTLNLPLDFIEQSIKEMNWSCSSKATPFLLNLHDSMFIAGVEEAYHVHQMVSDPKRFAELGQSYDASRGRGNATYDEQPLEKEARDVVRQAMIDTGIVHRSPVQPYNIDTETAQWAAPYLRERTNPTVANNITPFARVVTISADGVVTSHPEPALTTSPR
jgi:hypothetical protein